MALLKSEKEIMVLEESGKILAKILGELSRMAVPGANLLDLDAKAAQMCEHYNAAPAFLGYQPEGAEHPYPASICASLNDIVVHGVPYNYELRQGDLLKIDMGVIYEGMYTDSATTVAIGNVSALAKKLMASTRKALEAGIAMAQKGNTLGDVGWAIDNQARKDGFYVLKNLTGHGVGYELHERPDIFNFGRRGEGMAIKEGMVLALEPMLSVSTPDIVQNDDESYSSADGSLTAHFEHTIAITSHGTKILTVA
jgi:methionyl aminopeptidase